MPQIQRSRELSVKQLLKLRRKYKIRTEMDFRDIKSKLNQLTPVDQDRIHRRVWKEKPHLWYDLIHKLVNDFVETIVV